MTITWTIEIEINTHLGSLLMIQPAEKDHAKITCVKRKYSTKTLEMERTQKEHAKGKIWCEEYTSIKLVGEGVSSWEFTTK